MLEVSEEQMIYLDSRYVDGTLLKAYKNYSSTYQQAVYRTWPTYTVNSYSYLVNEVDRIENIAATRLGNASLWWKIMDINPEIINPFEIPAGTLLRIPNG